MKKKFRGLMTGALALALLTFAAAGCAKETGGGDGAPETTPPAETTDVAGGGETGAPETGSPDGGYTEAELLALPEDSGDSYDYDEVDEGIRILGHKGIRDTIVIPSEIDGKEVTQIAETAFRYANDLKAVVIPESVKKIGKGAFSGCLELVNVYFSGEGLKEIEEQAFEACSKLSGINLPATIEKIGFCAFLGCASIKQVELPVNITIIEAGTFGISGLESVKLHSNITEIKSGAFANCFGLLQCEIPDSVVNIHEDAFENSPVIIVASPDSYAAQYAAERGIEFQAA